MAAAKAAAPNNELLAPATSDDILVEAPSQKAQAPEDPDGIVVSVLNLNGELGRLQLIATATVAQLRRAVAAAPWGVPEEDQVLLVGPEVLVDDMAPLQSWAPTRHRSSAQSNLITSEPSSPLPPDLDVHICRLPRHYVFAFDGRATPGPPGCCEALDVRADAWEPLPPMACGRHGLAATAATAVGPNNRPYVFVVGGEDMHGLVVGTTELFDPGSGAWSQAPAMTEPRYGHTATTTTCGMLVVTGGWGENGDILDTAEALDVSDPDTPCDAWKVLPEMTRGRCSHASVFHAGSGVVLVLGGLSTNSRAVGPTEALAVSSGALVDAGAGWATLPGVQTPRYDLAAAVLGQGLGAVLALGGRDDDGCTLRSAEAFDVETGSWTYFPSLIQARHSLAAASLGDRVYVLGGRGEDHSALDTVECYDHAASASWKSAPCMSSPRSGLGAVGV